MEIPVIDLAPIVQENPKENRKKCVADKLCQAFTEVGFAFLTNHGIPWQQVTDVITTSDVFFQLPVEIKEKYARKGNETHGWVSLGRESLNPARPHGDLKECLHYNTRMGADNIPTAHAPGLQPAAEAMFRSCTSLAHTVLELMAIGLGLDDPKHFCKKHNFESLDNSTVMRLLYYPPLTADSPKAAQVRCGEHSDYGSITLLFQDAVGGLEVQSRQYGYVPAIPTPDTILVNIGDIMQRWTSDQLISTKHRVLIPEEELQKRMVRRSVALFVKPDDGCIVECLDGSRKYEPITTLDYMNMRIDGAYAHTS